MRGGSDAGGLARAPPPPHVYEDYASKQQKYPRPHTDDVDPKRYMYRVETPPPTQTYTYTVDVPSAVATRKGAAERWERTSMMLRTGPAPPVGSQPQDWRQDSGPPHSGEQVFRPSVSGTAPQDAQCSAYVAPVGRMRVGRGMSNELLHGDESKTFVTHKGFTHERAHTRDKPLKARQPLPRQPNPVERSASAPSLQGLAPGFKATVGYSHHKSGFVPAPTTTAAIVQETDHMDAGMFVEPVCEDPNLGTGRFGNFACAPARPTCLLTTRPRASPSARATPSEPGFEAPSPGSSRGLPSASGLPPTAMSGDFTEQLLSENF
jgi:hypothetical protein